MCPLVNKNLPFVKDKLEACYCNSLNSMNIEKIVYYCQKNFEECEIYRSLYSNEPNGIQA